MLGEGSAEGRWLTTVEMQVIISSSGGGVTGSDVRATEWPQHAWFVLLRKRHQCPPVTSQYVAVLQRQAA